MDDTKIRERERLLKALTRHTTKSVSDISKADINEFDKVALAGALQRSMVKFRKVLKDDSEQKFDEQLERLAKPNKFGKFRKKGEE